MALAVVVPTASYATLTFNATTMTGDGVVAINGGVASASTIGATNTTGTLTIGGSAQTGSTTLQSATVLGTTTNSAFPILADAVTSGTAIYLTADALTSGEGLLIDHTTGAIINSGSLARLSSTSIDTGITTGNLLDLSSTASTAGTQVLGTFTALTTGIGASFVMDALTTGTGMSITNASGVMVDAGNLLTLTAPAATTAAGLLRITAAGLTTGIGEVITSSSTVLTGAGRLLYINHTGTSTAATTAKIVEIASAATEDTEIFKVTASGALAAGLAVNISAAAMTTGTALNIPGLAALTSGKGISVAHTVASAIENGGTLLSLASAGNDIATTSGALINLSSTASTSGTQVLSTFSALTDGIGESIVAAALTTGKALSITAGGVAALTDGAGLLVTGPSGAATITNNKGLVQLVQAGAFTTTAGSGGVLDIIANGTITGTVASISDSAIMLSAGNLLTLTANAATTATGLLTISGTGLTTGTALLVNGSAPATMTAAGSFIRVNDATTNVFRVGWNGHITSGQTTAPGAAYAGQVPTCTDGAGTDGKCTDTRGIIVTTTTADTNPITLTFNRAYTIKPVCVVTPLTLLTQVDFASATKAPAITTTTTTLVITPGAGNWTGSVKTIGYFCIE